MRATLPNFQDKYYEYGEKGLETKVLAIRGHESALLADLVDSYFFEVTKNKFKELLWRGIYRYNGLLLFKGNRSIPEYRIWRGKFQEKFYEIQETITYSLLVKIGTQVETNK